jgi:hypothetical protein
VVPEWELLVHTPAVFVRAANTRLTGYRTWKKIRNLEELLEGPPLPPPFLKRYDSKRVRGWGSAKRLWGKDLGKRKEGGNEITT